MSGTPERLADERGRLLDAFEVAVVEREAAADNYGEAKARTFGDCSSADFRMCEEMEAAYDAACERVHQARAELLRAAPSEGQRIEGVARFGSGNDRTAGSASVFHWSAVPREHQGDYPAMMISGPGIDATCEEDHYVTVIIHGATGEGNEE